MVFRAVIFVECIEMNVLAWSGHVGLTVMVDWSEDKPVRCRTDGVCRDSSQIYDLLNGITARVTPWGIYRLVNDSPESLDVVAQEGV